MTRRSLLILLALAAAALVAILVWPESERAPERVIDQNPDTMSAPDYDPRLNWGADQAVQRAQQAGEEMKKMNEAASKTAEH